ncbi:hypothetical protein PRIPAC_73401 [Pristionchus pacificus]|uniref:RING-type domain-containing protein n=1 Tax=Pristionchus pacificus TaxID=54126 RepID=A0A2A6CRX4_PRIPA|nr:hypothetical protein PRIPAC_73401 [Pristionchus pacificus]|eukprot:PDM80889.1 hypothetical protein PRIPAC_35892 [Pristionchus pacificus]
MSRSLSPSDDPSSDFIHVTQPQFGDRSNKEEKKKEISDSLDENQWESVAPSVITPLLPQMDPVQNRPSSEEKERNERMKEEERMKKKREEMAMSMARESIAIVREKQEKLSTEPIFFSRLCPVCKVRHPTHRVLFSSCGHTTCHVCQMENRLHTNSDQCPHCKIESGWISIIEEEDPSPILPECTCKRIRRTIGQWKDQLRSLFKFAN